MLIPQLLFLIALFPTQDGLSDELRQAIQSAPSADRFPNSSLLTILRRETTFLGPDATTITRIRTVRKVLTDAGRSAAEVSLNYSGHYDQMTILTARTIQSDGRMQNVLPTSISDEPVYSGAAMYEDTRAKSFVFPDVRVGSVLELEYETDSRPRMPGFFHHSEFLLSSTPTVQSSTVITAASRWKLRHRSLNGAPPIKIETLSDGRNRYTIEYSQLEELKGEPNMPPPKQIFPYVEIASETSWAEIDKWFQSLAKGREALPAIAKTVVQGIVSRHSSLEDRVKAVYRWVQQNIRYVAVELGESGYQPHSAEQICTSKYGDCKDMSTLLVGMLRAAQVEATWALIRFDSRNEPPDLYWEGPYSFDHCIARAQVGDRVYWLDATGGYFGAEDVPSSLAGCKALVIEKGQFEKLPDFGALPPMMEVDASVIVKPDGSATVKLSLTGRQDMAAQLRATFADLSPKELEEIKESMPKSFAKSGKITNLTWTDTNDWDRPMTMTADMELQEFALTPGNVMLVPRSLGGFAGAGGSAAFTDPSRKYPIFFTEAPKTKTSIRIEFPEGFELLASPDLKSQDFPGSRIESDFKLSGNVVTSTSLVIGKDETLPVGKYEDVRKAYLKQSKFGREVFVLRKKVE